MARRPGNGRLNTNMRDAVSTRERISLVLVLAAMLAGGARVTAQVAAPAQPEEEVATAPVELDGTVLLRVRGVSSLPAAERARLIQERLTEIAADETVTAESVTVVDDENVSRIMAGDRLLLGVTDADASIEQVSRPVLAAAHARGLREAIAAYRAARSPSALRRNALNALGGTVALIAAVLAVFWARRRLDRLLTNRLRTRIHTVGIQQFEVMRAERIWAALSGALNALRTISLLALGLVYIGFVLAQFPRTRGLSRGMVAFALAPLEVIASGIVAHIPSLIFLVVLFFVFRLALRIIRLFFDAIERRTVTLANFDPDWAQPTYKIVRVLVVAFGLIVAYPYIPGSESAAFRGVSLFIGIVFSLGSSSAIANIIAGYMMTYRRAFKVGDRVKVGDAFGEVIEMRLQVTHLRSPKNEEIVIPNSQILGSEVINYSSLARTHGLILHTEVGIGYETPWRQVEAMLILAAQRTSGLSMEPPPFVLHKKLGDFAVTYELNVYCSNVPAMMRLYTDLHRNILDVFNEYGVQIMTPAYEGDPEQPKVVRPKDWYTAPALAKNAGTPSAV
jgi:small-conductance mechanosensitive channel